MRYCGILPEYYRFFNQKLLLFAKMAREPKLKAIFWELNPNFTFIGFSSLLLSFALPEVKTIHLLPRRCLGSTTMFPFRSDCTYRTFCFHPSARIGRVCFGEIHSKTVSKHSEAEDGRDAQSVQISTLTQIILAYAGAAWLLKLGGAVTGVDSYYILLLY